MNVLSPLLLIAVTTKTRLPQAIGLELEMPGIGVFQRTLVPCSTFQVTIAPCPSPLPAALSPRNPGHGFAVVRAAGFIASALTAPVPRPGAVVPPPAAPAPAAPAPAAGVPAPAVTSAVTRSYATGVLFCVRMTRSIMPPRPANANRRPSNSAILNSDSLTGISVPGGWFGTMDCELRAVERDRSRSRRCSRLR